MSLLRMNPKRDASEPDIIQRLRAFGCLVLRLSGDGIPDLLVGHRGRWAIVECKTGKGKLTANQGELFQRCRMKRLPAFVLRTADEVPEMLKVLRSKLYAPEVANRADT